MSKHITVVCDAASGMVCCELTLSDGASIEDALASARAALGQAAEAGIDWASASAGVYGRVRPRSFVPRDGDRVELYRTLASDPRAVRRRRLAGALRTVRGNARRGASRS